MYLSNYKEDEEDMFLLSEYNQKECIICYDILDNNNNKAILFKAQDKYITSCNCNVIIHITCLDNWYNYHKRCIICSNELIQKKYLLFLINDNSLYNISYFLYKITNHICYISRILINVFCCIMFIYVMAMFFFIWLYYLLNKLGIL